MLSKWAYVIIGNNDTGKAGFQRFLVSELCNRQYERLPRNLLKDGREVRPGGIAVMRIGFELDSVVRAEPDHAERPGAGRPGTGRSASRRPGAGAARELRFLQDRRCGADEWAVGMELGDLEDNFHGQIVDRPDGCHIGAPGRLGAAAAGVAAIGRRSAP